MHGAQTMGSQYKHLTDQDRIFLSMMVQKRYSASKIAQILKVNPSTIYREIKRNSAQHRASGLSYYLPIIAQRKALERKKRGLRLEKDAALRQYVNAKLKAGWSPEQIEWRLKRDHSGRCLISHESIYRYVYSDKTRQYLLHKYLRRKHQYRTKPGERKPRFPQELLIASRPDYINDRSEFGHWECDLMLFKKGVKTNLITLRERKSRFLIAIKNENKEASGTALALISTVSKIKKFVKSITFDQGSEFMKYNWIKDTLEADVYFCNPASPYQKGAVENVNGVIRVDLPRTHDVNSLKQKDLNKLSKSINNRPLKCLDYLTPAEIFNTLTMSQPHEN